MHTPWLAHAFELPLLEFVVLPYCPALLSNFLPVEKSRTKTHFFLVFAVSDDDDDVNGKFKLDDLYVVKVGAGSKQQFQYENGDIQCQFY
jgi:hypothetical protein